MFHLGFLFISIKYLSLFSYFLMSVESVIMSPFVSDIGNLYVLPLFFLTIQVTVLPIY